MAGSDALAVVSPAAESLTGIFAASSNASWLSLGSVSGGALNFSFTENTGTARTAYITVLGQQVEVTQAAILAATTLDETAAAGSGSDVVSYGGSWTATANAAWLHTSSSGDGDGTATFTFDANTGPARTGTLTIAGQTLTVTQAAALGTVALVEGQAAGSDSDVVSYAGPWTSTANVSWLQTASTGSGSGLATFSFDANPGPTRTGTLTIAGQTLTVTQAGSGYVAANTLTTLIPSPLVAPEGIAVDSAGNVYIADTGDNAIKEWNATTHLLSTLVSSGLSGPMDVAVDAAGNVYIADTGDNAIKEWNAATKSVSALVSSGLEKPEGVAVDASGNVYIADSGNNAIKEWNAETQTVSVLVSSGLYFPVDVAVGTAGDVYIAEVDDNTIREWNAATQTVGTLVTVTSLNNNYRLAVAASGNVYIADTYDSAILMWNATTHNVNTLVSSGLSGPQGLAVDASGNVYIAGTFDNTLKVWSPSTQTLNTLIAPAAGVPGSLAVNGAGNLYILGSSASGTAVNEWKADTQTISTLFSSALQDIAVDTSGNVYGSVDNALEEWNASTQSISALVPSGFSEASSVVVDGAGNVYFVEENAGYDTTGMVCEWNVTTQTLSTLVSSGLGYPQGIAVDASGNVYIPDTSDVTIEEWNAATQTVGSLVSSGLGSPQGVAVDGSGNVYIADSGDKAIKEWNAATQTLTTLVSSGLSSPSEVAVDAVGNVYILDGGDDAIEELPRAFVPGGPIKEGAAAGSDALAAVLPAGQSLTGVFAPTSDQSWLTVGKVSGGVVNFAFTANSGSVSRTAHIGLLGRSITVTQAAAQAAAPPAFTLSSPASGSYVAGATIPILWTAANVPSGSLISLAYDTTSNWGSPKWIEIDGVTAADGSGSYNWNTTGLAVGTYYLDGYLYTPSSATAVMSHLTTSFRVTAAAPAFTLIAPAAETFVDGQTVSVQWSAANVRSGSSISLAYESTSIRSLPVWIEIDGLSAFNGIGSYSWNTTGLAAGTYCMYGYLYTPSTGTAVVSHLTTSFTVTGSPTFTLSRPASGSYVAGATISIPWTTANVPSGSLISLAYDTTSKWGNPKWIEIDGVTAGAGSGSYKWNTTGLAAGTYYLDGYMYTPSSGTAVMSHLTTSFAVTAAPPTFTLSSPASRSYVAGATISIPWTTANVPSGSTISLAYDTTSNWGNPKWIEIDGVTAADGSGTYNWDIAGLAAGTYYLDGYMYTPSLRTAVMSHLTTSFTVTG